VSRRSLVFAYFLWFFVGAIGGHRFYLGHYGWGFIYLITGGLFGLGWFVDGFTLPGMVDQLNRDLDEVDAPIPPARVVAG